MAQLIPAVAGQCEGGGRIVKMKGDRLLKSHFLIGSLPEEILKTLMLYENGQSREAVEIVRETER